ncbi:hypothetical protein PB2503_06877 [Parvularcula bermudensis HTCC2503]|uniref:Tetratricopeptide repeat protein n=2 Tax=Parvularcula TaxID=208215 RepID=E0TE66_PARBH|nr:hypothetical protein PB2503_06877 [Parvularcula bermudensis HTCC2503]
MSVEEATTAVQLAVEEQEQLTPDDYDKVLATLSSHHDDPAAQYYLGELFMRLSAAKMFHTAITCYRRANQSRHDPALGRIGLIQSGLMDGTPADLVSEGGALRALHAAASEGVRDAADGLMKLSRKLSDEYDHLFLELRFGEESGKSSEELAAMQERLEDLGILLEEDGAMRRERSARRLTNPADEAVKETA